MTKPFENYDRMRHFPKWAVSTEYMQRKDHWQQSERKIVAKLLRFDKVKRQHASDGGEDYNEEEQAIVAASKAWKKE